MIRLIRGRAGRWLIRCSNCGTAAYLTDQHAAEFVRSHRCARKVAA